SGVGVSDTPFLVDLTGDGILDSVVLDNSGNILYRAGLPGSSGAFAPPVILNPGRPARAITVLRIGSQFAIAAADAHFDPMLSNGRFVFTVSIYTPGAAGDVSSRVVYGPPPQLSSTYRASEGMFTRSDAFATTALPTSLAAADLTGNGLDDLIVANALDNSVTIVLKISPGPLAAPIVGAAGTPTS